MKADVYPVGLLHDLRGAWLIVRATAPDNRTKLRAIRRLGREFRKHWRRRSYWNGYLAEPTEAGHWTRCGHGWTQIRARRDLARHTLETRYGA